MSVLYGRLVGPLKVRPDPACLSRLSSVSLCSQSGGFFFRPPRITTVVTQHEIPPPPHVARSASRRRCRQYPLLLCGVPPAAAGQRGEGENPGTWAVDDRRFVKWAAGNRTALTFALRLGRCENARFPRDNLHPWQLAGIFT